MKAGRIGGWGLLGVLLFGGPLPAQALIQCHLTFTLEGWSFFYRTSSGSGTITCDDGQSVHVSLSSRGGGLTFGSSSVLEGRGTFSPVASIDDLFGRYGSAMAHAGMGRSTYAQVVTKGRVSLALSGTGSGVDVGFSFGRFEIERARWR